jgi:hypothetical protein
MVHYKGEFKLHGKGTSHATAPCSLGPWGTGFKVRALPDALRLPLGPKPTAALQYLVRLGVLARDRVLEGMPHPSGANGERIKFFLGEKPRAKLSRKTRPALIEAARKMLVAQVVSLQSA